VAGNTPIRAWRPFALLPLGAALVVAGCGHSTKSSANTSQTTSTPTTTTSPGSPNALQAEANAAATGDIPDNQVFLAFRNPGTGGWSMKYPEGWAQSGSRDTVTFRDKNNIVRVAVVKRAPTTAGNIRGEITASGTAHLRSGPQRMTISGAPAVKVVYTTSSAPNPVTGKRVTLLVDRYYLAHRGKEALVDLGTPLGVDNVDAYRLMIESFRWR
jgi:hypothetical protein